MADRHDAVARELAFERRADAGDQPDRLLVEEVERLAAPDHREASRLVEIRGDLRQELVVAEADRDSDADLALDPAGQERQRARRRPAMQPLGAGEVEERL